MALNPRQQAAVNRIEGPLMIIAGPGTGKTKTLVERVRHLVMDCAVPADRIAVTTFTNKAANELISRLGEDFAAVGRRRDATALLVCNFHSLAQQVLEHFPKHLPYLPGYRLMEDAQRIQLLMRGWDALSGPALERFFPRLSSPPELNEVRRIARWLDQLREGFVDLSAPTPETADARSVLDSYIGLLYAENRIDFSGLLYEALNILRRDERAKAYFQSRCTYLMVDEYQDTNPIQEQMIRLLSEASGNLCVVGDDDQSLYRFRGATVHNLLSFPERYPDAVQIVLEENYRSAQGILDFSRRFIDGACAELIERETIRRRLRFSKAIRAAGETRLIPGAVQALLADSKETWTARMVALIRQHRDAGYAMNDLAILSYSIRSARMTELIRELRRSGIGIRIIKEGKLTGYAEIKQLMACYFFTFAGMLEHLTRAKPLAAARLSEHADAFKRLPETGRAERTAVANSAIKRLFDGKAIDIIRLGLDFLNLPPFAERLGDALDGDEAAVREAEHLADFMQLIACFAEDEDFRRVDRSNGFRFLERFFDGFLPFLDRAKVDGANAGELERTGADRLSVMTIHQSKGLEFDTVILVEPEPSSGMAWTSRTGLEPLVRNPALGEPLPDSAEAALDRIRLYYTAFTRAKRRLILSGIDAQAFSWPAASGEANGTDALFSSINMALPPFVRPLPPPPHDMRSGSAQSRYAYTTDIGVYERCPRRYFFDRRAGFPEPFAPEADYGSFVHLAIQLAHRELIDGASTEVAQACALDRAAKSFAVRGLAQDERARERAAEALSRYFEAQGEGYSARVDASEMRLLWSSGSAILFGTADLVLDGGSRIVDFKTGKRPASLEAYQNQLKFYRMLYNETHDAVDARDALWFLDEATPETAMAATSHETLSAAIHRTVGAIEAGAFADGAGDPQSCAHCPYRVLCLERDA